VRYFFWRLKFNKIKILTKKIYVYTGRESVKYRVDEKYLLEICKPRLFIKLFITDWEESQK